MPKYTHKFVEEYDGHVGFGFDREVDEATLICYLQMFLDDRLTGPDEESVVGSGHGGPVRHDLPINMFHLNDAILVGVVFLGMLVGVLLPGPAAVFQPFTVYLLMVLLS